MPLFENLKVGGWYQVLEHEDEPEQQQQNPFMYSTPQKIRYNGVPYRILAVSFPFILCKDVRGKSVTMDTRVTKLTACLDSFVRAFSKEFGRDDDGNPVRKKQRKKKETADRYTCPRCGGRIVQIMNRNHDGWRFTCQNCEFDGGAVPKV